MAEQPERAAPLVLVARACADRDALAALVQGQAGARVLYLGSDSKLSRELGVALAPHARILVAGELVNEAAGHIREDFINMDRHLRAPERDAFWQISDTAERNPYSSSLFFNCCALLAVVHAAQEPGLLLVLAQEPHLAGHVVRVCQDQGIRVKRIGRLLERLRPLAALVETWGLFVQALRELRKFLRQFKTTRKLLADHPRRRPTRDETPDVLLVTWASSSSFGPGEKANDAYFGPLPGQLKQAGLKLAYLALPISWVEPEAEILSSLARSPDPILLPEDCLSLADALLLAARSLLWRVRFCSPVLLGGLDMTQVVARSASWDRTGQRLLWAARFGFVGRHLARLGVRPGMVLHLFENQPWEKALRAGLHRYLPGVRVCGFQHVPFSRFYLSYYPSRLDLRHNLMPDLLFVTGPAWRDIFLSHGWTPSRVCLAPALRLDYLHAVAARNKTLPDPSGQSEIVVAGAMDFPEMYEMLACKIFPAAAANPKTRVTVKFHPRMSQSLVQALHEALRAVAGEEGGRYHVSTEDMCLLVRRAAAIVYQSSGVGFEALCAGATPIFVRSDTGLDVNPMDWFAGSSLDARSPQELAAAINTVCHETPDDRTRRRELAQSILARGFLAVNEKNLAGLLAIAKSQEPPGGPGRKDVVL